MAAEVPVRGRRALTSGDNRVEGLRVRKVDGTWRAFYRRSVSDLDLSVPSTATLDRDSLWAVNADFGTGDETFEVNGRMTRVLAEQTAAVEPGRLGDTVGHPTFDELRHVEAALRLVLDL